MKDWILVGGGGHASSCFDALWNSGQRVKGYLDRKRTELDMPWNYLGEENVFLNNENPKSYNWHLAVGHLSEPTTRIHIWKRFKHLGINFSTLIANTASVSNNSSIGEGCSVLHNAFINSGVSVGKMTILNTNSLVEHETKIGDFCHISTGAILNGGVSIGDRVFVGSGAIIIQNIKIAPDVIVGAGSIVLDSILEKGTWVGNPARRIA